MSASIDGTSTSSLPHKRKTSDSIDSSTALSIIRDNLAKILSSKKEGVQFKEDKDVQELFADISLAFSDLKGDNRDAQMENEVKKTEVSKEKQQLNQFNLQLQNILYEKNHFMKEIKQCRDFTFNEKDHNLIPLEVFMSSAPADLTSTTDPHQLMVNRLNYEIQERKRLCEQIQELKARKKALFELNSNKQKFLTSLPDKLNTLTQVSLPIQSHMGLTITRDTQQKEVAQYLPASLYTLFTQAIAFKSVHKTGANVEVLIVGNLEEAISVKNKESAKQEADHNTSVVIVADVLKPSTPIPHDGDESEEEERELRHSVLLESKPDYDLPAEDKSVAQKIAKAELYKPFPLSIVVELKSKEPKEKSVGIRFDYLPSLQVTTAYPISSIPPIASPTPPPPSSLLSPSFPPPATPPAPSSSSSSSTAPATTASSSSSAAASTSSSSSSSSSSSASSSLSNSSSSSSASGVLEDRFLLSNIFPNDAGLTSPNPSTYIVAPDASFSPAPSSPCPGLPYRWVQWLTSTLSPSSPSLSLSPFGSLPATYNAVFSAIRERLVSRAALRSQIDSLAKLTVPALYNKKGFPQPTQFVLVLWKEIPRADFEEVEPVPLTEEKSDDREEGECPASPVHPSQLRKSATSAAGGHFTDDVAICGTHIPWEKVGARYFRAVFQRAETQVQALIEIGTDYPSRPPRFKLKTLLRIPQPPSSSSSSSTSSSSSSSSSSSTSSSSSHSSSSSTSSSSSSSSSHSSVSARPPHVPATQPPAHPLPLSHAAHPNFPLANPLLPHLPLLGAHLPPHLAGSAAAASLGLPHLSHLPHVPLQHPLHLSHLHFPPPPSTILSTPSTTTILFPHGTTNHLASPLAATPNVSSPPLASSSSSAKGKESTKDREKEKEKEKEKGKELQLQQQIIQQQQLEQLQLLMPADNHIKSIEVEVNTQTNELLLDGDANNRLATQIRKLQQCLDVYYEVVVKETSLASGQPSAQAPTREGKLCVRTHRGRARLLPLVFNESTGLFDQRSYNT